MIFADPSGVYYVLVLRCCHFRVTGYWKTSYKYFSCIQKPEMHYMTISSWHMCLIMGIWISDSFEPVNWVMFNFYAQKTRLLKSCVCLCRDIACEWVNAWVIYYCKGSFSCSPKGKMFASIGRSSCILLDAMELNFLICIGLSLLWAISIVVFEWMDSFGVFGLLSRRC